MEPRILYCSTCYKSTLFNEEGIKEKTIELFEQDSIVTYYQVDKNNRSISHLRHVFSRYKQNPQIISSSAEYEIHFDNGFIKEVRGFNSDGGFVVQRWEFDEKMLQVTQYVKMVDSNSEIKQLVTEYKRSSND